MKKIFRFVIVAFSLLLVLMPVKVFGKWEKKITHEELQNEQVYKDEIKRVQEWRMEGLLKEGTFSFLDKMSACFTGISSWDAYDHARECLRIVREVPNAKLYIKTQSTCFGLGSERVYYSYFKPVGGDVSCAPSPLEYPW